MIRLLATLTVFAAFVGLLSAAEAQLRTSPTGPAPMGTGTPNLMTPSPAPVIGNTPLGAVGAPPTGAVGAPPVGAIGNTPLGTTAPPAGGMVGGMTPNPVGPSQLATPGPGPAIDLNQFDNRLQ